MGKIKKCNRKELIPHASEECLDLVGKMMEFDPDKRISIEQILSHPYLADFYNKKELIPA
jgi:serine/threonine protein kinase